MPETPKQSVALLVDKRILAGGASMTAVGIVLTTLFAASMPVGQAGMTEEETIDLLVAQQELQDYSILSGILIAVGFMLTLISFGARKKRKGRAQSQKGPGAATGDDKSMQRI